MELRPIYCCGNYTENEQLMLDEIVENIERKINVDQIDLVERYNLPLGNILEYFFVVEVEIKRRKACRKEGIPHTLRLVS